MLLSISHRTELSYAEPISESVIELRMTPRSDGHQTLRAFGLTVGPEAPVFQHLDWQGNHAHHFSIIDVHDKVVIIAASTVEMHPRKLRLEELPDTLPLTGIGHRHEDFLLSHGPVQRDARLAHFAEETGLLRERRAGLVLAAVTGRLQDLVTYTKGVTHSSTTVGDVLDLGKGVCQDYAHVALALLRMLGLPSRYVSGYLFRPSSAELETHAWVEVFLPSVGWMGIDPTHAQLAGESHVGVAIGRSYADVPPNRGVYRGGAEERIDVSVRICELEAQLELPPLALPRPDVRALHDRIPPDRRLDYNTLEQQRHQQQQQQQ
ncbi:MAG TPA: transglutaminase family protein [Polyangiaceae bacterium]|nr:transglutaminase family protein [Polyangiaceae bacterium]